MGFKCVFQVSCLIWSWPCQRRLQDHHSAGGCGQVLYETFSNMSCVPSLQSTTQNKISEFHCRPSIWQKGWRFSKGICKPIFILKIPNWYFVYTSLLCGQSSATVLDHHGALQLSAEYVAYTTKVTGWIGTCSGSPNTIKYSSFYLQQTRATVICVSVISRHEAWMFLSVASLLHCLTFYLISRDLIDSRQMQWFYTAERKKTALA